MARLRDDGSSPRFPDRSTSSRRRRAALLYVALAGVCVLGSHLSTRLWGLQGRSAPSVLEPAPGLKGTAVILPRGEMLLLRLLQDFANYVGERVYADGDISPTAMISLEKRPTRLEVTTMRKLLEEHEYELSRAPYGGSEVYWVQKLLVRPRRKGGLTPTRGFGGGRSATEAVDRGRDADGASLCLYQRIDGEGTRYVVLLETASKQEAEDALTLLRAHQRSKGMTKPQTPNPNE